MRTRTLTIFSFAIVLALCLALGLTAGPSGAMVYADETVSVDKDGQKAVSNEASFGIVDFYRAQVGSNRMIEGTYHGYTYYLGDEAGSFSCVFVNVESQSPYAVLYIPKDAGSFGCEAGDVAAVSALKSLIYELDLQSAAGGNTLTIDACTYYVTSETTYELNNIVFTFDTQIVAGERYTTVCGKDGSDVTQPANPNYIKLGHCSYGKIAAKNTISVTSAATGIAAFGEFLASIDYSPLWVTLKTTCTAILFIFILGLLAAHWSLRLTPRWQNVFDTLFTIPMVLPPTVCGFLLLLFLGGNTPWGQWFISIGFPLIFSWPATVIAAVVVAFPLMYRSARGAFENLDANMLDCARTLGWSEFRIFRKLMLPLSWSSIAAGTVLAFARALGEFGATLFLAGNYAGITATIPIAIYFEWMDGSSDVALFWTAVIIVFSFLVILLINMWSRRTVRYRRKDAGDVDDDARGGGKGATDNRRQDAKAGETA